MYKYKHSSHHPHSPGGMPGASPQQMMSTTGFSSHSSSSANSHEVQHAEGIAKSREEIRQSIGADVLMMPEKDLLNSQIWHGRGKGRKGGNNLAEGQRGILENSRYENQNQLEVVRNSKHTPKKVERLFKIHSKMSTPRFRGDTRGMSYYNS
jgi:hypothetical protein